MSYDSSSDSSSDDSDAIKQRPKPIYANPRRRVSVDNHSHTKRPSSGFRPRTRSEVESRSNSTTANRTSHGFDSGRIKSSGSYNSLSRTRISKEDRDQIVAQIRGKSQNDLGRPTTKSAKTRKVRRPVKEPSLKEASEDSSSSAHAIDVYKYGSRNRKKRLSSSSSDSD